MSPAIAVLHRPLRPELCGDSARVTRGVAAEFADAAAHPAELCGVGTLEPGWNAAEFASSIAAEFAARAGVSLW